MYPTVLALRICMYLFTFDFFFSCLSSHFFLSHPQERMHFFSCGRMLSLPFWRVCAPFGTCVRTAHACMLIVRILVVLGAFFFRLSLEQQQ